MVKLPATTVIVQQSHKLDKFKQLLSQAEFFAEAEALFIFKSICLGVQELHKAGIALQFFSLDNIVLTDEAIKVSPLLKPQDNEFQAPETLQNNVVNEKSDMWTLGIILHTLLFGYPPFSGSKQEIIDKQFSGVRDKKR